jgi:hypothetical protein
LSMNFLPDLAEPVGGNTAVHLPLARFRALGDTAGLEPDLPPTPLGLGRASIF